VFPDATFTRALAAGGVVETIDVLPLDLQVWAEPGYDATTGALQGRTATEIMTVAVDSLDARNYKIAAMIDWNGDYDGGNALAKDDLLATVGALSHYGAATAGHPGRGGPLPVPYLPARLGTATGADATLYMGGWSYVSMSHDDDDDDHHHFSIGELLLVGVLVVGLIAIIAGATKSHGHSGGGGHGGGDGHGSAGGGHGSRGSAGHVGGSGGHVGGGGHGGGGIGGGGSIAVGGGGTGHRVGGGHVGGAPRLHHHPRLLSGVADAFGRVAEDIAFTAPDWEDDPALPHDNGPSQMYLEMTLIDNHTGLALWHAQQLFPADATNQHDVTRAANMMLQTLPVHRSQPVAAGAPPSR